MPDELWQRIEPLLPPEKPKGKGTQGGRPNADRHRTLDAIFFVEDLVAGYGYTAHIRRRGEEKKDLKQILGFRARRGVVERTHSWMNRFRRLLIRWEKKKANYLAMLHLACAFITFHAPWFSDRLLTEGGLDLAWPSKRERAESWFGA